MKKSKLNPISKKPHRRARRTILPASMKALKARSEGQCERLYWNNGGYRCQSKASDPHHILARSQGGTHELSNLIHLCRLCHNFCKEYPIGAVECYLVKPYKGFQIEDIEQWVAAKRGFMNE